MFNKIQVKDVKPGDIVTARLPHATHRPVGRVSYFNDVFSGRWAVELTFTDRHERDANTMAWDAETWVEVMSR